MIHVLFMLCIFVFVGMYTSNTSPKCGELCHNEIIGTYRVHLRLK